jgi:hypothetical protein
MDEETPSYSLAAWAFKNEGAVALGCPECG